MKNLKPMQNTTNTPEPGEEELALLIKEAGNNVRAENKKMMEEHYKKIHQAVTGTLLSSIENKSA